VATAFPDAQVELWATDEHRIGLKPILQRVWVLPGQRPVAPVEPRYQWRYLVAFAQPSTGRTVWQVATGVSTALFSTELAAFAAEPIVISDFEGADYGGWKTTGTAFGDKPAHGAFPHQMKVDGFLGKGLVNSFNGGDGATGTLTSPTFRIERKFITFLIGGGGWEGETCMNLLVDGKAVRTATGPNTKPGGSEHLDPLAWEVSEFAGRDAVIQIVDQRKGGWGHINVDHIVQTDDRGAIALAAPPKPMLHDATREVVVEKKLLHFPVKNGAKKHVVTVAVDGAVQRRFDIELADAEPDWWAPLDVSAWMGKTLRIVADELPEHSRALAQLRQADSLLDADDLYREALRPQLQFSAKRGWNNDPNGLVFFNGEYHLFFQHNPYGWGWGNMHWGHATSRDLVHWEEHGEALYPDDMGPMFSGSAVVDWKNTSGLGRDGKPAMVMFYTAAGRPTTQCMAWSLDGRTFTKFAGNPVIEQITPGNRDPKVFWHEPTQRWVMVLYVGLPRANSELDSKGKTAVEHTIHFFTSPDLKKWTLRGQTPGLFECPDLFELPVDGDAAKKKWVLTAASSEYLVGTFDGEKFTPETPKLLGHRGPGFYAAQTYSDVPDGRRIQIGWGRAASPGMAFNQLLTFPCELKLRTTSEGVLLTWTPVKELASQRGKERKFEPAELTKDSGNPIKEVHGELLELRLALAPTPGSEVELTVKGLPIRYDAAKEELQAGEVRTRVPLRNGRLDLAVFTDRTMFTIFASDGLVYIPLPFIAKDRNVTLRATRGTVKLESGEVYELASIWSGAVKTAKAEASPATHATVASPPQAGGKVLYNGIQLPDVWPPMEPIKDRSVRPVPYLQHRPEVVPIDIGRQLFIDDFLVEKTSLMRKWHHPERYSGNPILKPETSTELNGGKLPTAAMISDGMCFDAKAGEFKMWYHAGWRDGTMLATSRDGLHWTRPETDVEPGNNRVLPKREKMVRHGTGISIDPYTTDASQRFKLLIYEDTNHKTGAYVSPDGIHWQHKGDLPECGDNATLFYNPFRQKWVFSIRLYRDGRSRNYIECDDFSSGIHWDKQKESPWAHPDVLDLPDPGVLALMPTEAEIAAESAATGKSIAELIKSYRSQYGDPVQLYNVDAIAYESVMLGTFGILKGPTSSKAWDKHHTVKILDLYSAFSRDGFHWDRPDREPFLASTRKPGDWERGYLHAGVGLCTVVGDRLYFYYSGWSADAPNGPSTYAGGATGVAFLRRDGFASMNTEAQEGTLTTRPVTFKGRYLFVNLDAPKGNLRAEVLDEAGKVIEPYSAANCMAVNGDKTKLAVTWNGAADISPISGRKVRFRFLLNDGALYSFWVTPDASGASHGYVAAGGPDFPGPIDTVGK